ncbi:hypothetical protein [Acidocella sp.]|uniref:hypothetical protein n=1 Tax=Acidocella sp. TaxID=50710 RepID=UPI003CFDF2D5
MQTQPDRAAPQADFTIDFDAPARKGWGAFTKFLFWNVAAAIFILLSIACLTVWR